MTRVTRWLLASALALVPAQAALAWGHAGHMLIAELAERSLDPATRSKIQRLLIDEPDPSLAGIASWADRVRDEEGWEWTAPMHYVKFADASCATVHAKDCRDDGCVDAAITRYLDDLGNNTLSHAQRVEALKFVVHFVGDAHQPLHAGWRPDKGGNDFQIQLPSGGSNLHSVWDSRVLGLHAPHVAAAADRLTAEVATAVIGSTDPRAWTGESCRLIDTIALYPARPGRLPRGYVTAFRPHSERRVVLAAARLSAVLEVALASR